MTKINLFISGLGASTLGNQGKGITSTILELCKQSQHQLFVILDREEVLRSTHNTSQARQASRGLLDQLIADIESITHPRFGGVKVRINPPGSEDYEKDCQTLLVAESIPEHIHSIYIPDIESVNQIMTVRRELNLPVSQLNPIIESQVGVDHITDIIRCMDQETKPGNTITLVGGPQARHYQLDLATHSDDPVPLTPDTLIGEDEASQKRRKEFEAMINSTIKEFPERPIHWLLPTSTYIGPGAELITRQTLEYFNNKYTHTNITFGKVCINPSQVTPSQGVPSLSHTYTEEEFITTYIAAKAKGERPILNDYILLDADFFIAVSNEFKRYGFTQTVEKYPSLQKYMGTGSIPLEEEIFDRRQEKIAETKDCGNN